MENSAIIKRCAVFFDRDGVINRALERDRKPYPPANLGEFEILAGVKESCQKLKAAGYILIVATNQPDVGRGTQQKEIVDQIHAYMLKELPLDDVEVCFHSGRGTSDCQCRKPKPGMLLHTAEKWNIDLAQSWMIGDRWRDIDCGHAAGCKTIFINRGYAEELRQKPDFTVSDISEASFIILNKKRTL
jgi:D-glycero-D-manno-heptose 1,7-bisphosphate phosphatase